MAVKASPEKLRELLLSGFAASPELAPIARDIVADDNSFERFLEWWNRSGPSTIGDLFVPVYHAGTILSPTLAVAPAQPSEFLLQFADSQPWYCTRMTSSTVGAAGAAFSNDRVLLFVAPDGNYNMTTRPIPASHFAGPGLQNIPLPVPLRIVPQQKLNVTVSYSAEVVTGNVLRTDVACHGVKLAIMQ